MTLLLNERENTLTISKDNGDIIGIYKILNLRDTRAMICDLISGHIFSEDGTTIKAEFINGSEEEMRIS